MERQEYGYIKIKLGDLVDWKTISKNKFCQRTELEFQQLDKYCNGKMTRFDLTILARLCAYFGCQVSDILEYVPPCHDIEEDPAEEL